MMINETNKTSTVCIGRFSPIHNGHVAMFQEAERITGSRPIIAIVKGRKPEDNPFTPEQRQAMFSDMGYQTVVIPTAWSFAEEIEMTFGITPTTIFCGPDRVEGYTKMVSYESFEYEINVIGCQEIGTTRATKVRQAIRQGQWGMVRRSVPSQVYKRIHRICV